MRELVPTDIEPLQRILTSCGVFSVAEIDCALELLDTVLNNPQQEDYEVLISEADGQVTGYAMFGPVPLTSGSYDLYWIATAPHLHGQGIGRTLLTEVEDRLQARGARMLCLETSSQDSYVKTRAFYLRAGYQEEARIKDFYRPQDDRITYVKRFTSC
ncbi:GNAT family N-acetyltransferase [Pelobacter seleniigenes]|uniref:GNAT family N-acetyltransferase n=1 Tax=Pelobacter seleniigenes TaxID=407188 RepID=UPI0004A72A78|nr:GNAT family N-acetyltransferase [Pelobacter seleniigenes]